jgi:DNA-binding GntR family transcriptional regulator
MSDRMGYVQIAAFLRKKIDDGVLRPGDALPSMRDVQKEFKVGTPTVERAFRVLRDEGLTTSKWGGATLVAPFAGGVVTGSSRIDRLARTGNEYSAGETSKQHSSRTLSLRDPQLCKEMGIDPGDEVVIRFRVFLTNGKPTAMGHSFIQLRAASVVPEIHQQGQLKPFWHDTYEERTGQKIHRSRDRFLARLASNDELLAFELDLPETVSAPIVVKRTTFHDDDGVLSVWEDICAPGLWFESQSKDAVVEFDRPPSD